MTHTHTRVLMFWMESLQEGSLSIVLKLRSVLLFWAQVQCNSDLFSLPLLLLSRLAFFHPPLLLFSRCAKRRKQKTIFIYFAFLIMVKGYISERGQQQDMPRLRMSTPIQVKKKKRIATGWMHFIWSRSRSRSQTRKKFKKKQNAMQCSLSDIDRYAKGGRAWQGKVAGGGCRHSSSQAQRIRQATRSLCLRHSNDRCWWSCFGIFVVAEYLEYSGKQRGNFSG